MQDRDNQRLRSWGKVINNGHNILLHGSERPLLVKIYRELGYTIGAEIGVGGGVFSEMICRGLPGVKLFAIDAWMPYDGYVDFTVQSYLEGDYARTLGTLKPFDATVIRKFSMDAVKEFDDNSLDFVYIDANHESPYIDNDISAWSRKVRSGGMVSGHDYAPNHKAVIQAVDEYVRTYNCGPLFLIGDPAEQGDDDARLASWFWIQP
jgi:hypothetical protein